MEYKDIKKLMEDMGNSKLTEIEIEFPDGIKISMKKGNSSLSNIQTEQISKKEDKLEKELTQKVEGNIVKAPMVGTFYIKSSPSSKPFIEIGDKIKKGDTLCIIEAMKLMNEIDSEFDGEIVDILIKDGEMVEYGKPLIIIK